MIVREEQLSLRVEEVYEDFVVLRNGLAFLRDIKPVMHLYWATDRYALFVGLEGCGNGATFFAWPALATT
jgi:hypothetical protein